MTDNFAVSLFLSGVYRERNFEMSDQDSCAGDILAELELHAIKPVFATIESIESD